VADRVTDEARVSGHYLGASGAAYSQASDPVWRIWAEFSARLFGPHVASSDVLVDFGCSTGELLTIVPARRKLGVEVNPTSRERARRAGHTVLARAEEVEPASADVVTSNQVLEHTLHPYVELQAMRAMLRPGGTLLLCVPIDDWRVQRRPPAHEPHNHLYGWTPRLLRNLLVEAGFDVRSTRIVTYGFPGRLTAPLHDALPRPLFDAAAIATAVLLRRRQLFAVAVRPPEPDEAPA
jgi:SAM-dependent methyltransferase